MVKSNIITKCSMNNCLNNSYAKGYCNKHYTRIRSHNDPNKVMKKGKRKNLTKCSVQNCFKPFHAKNYCEAHYCKWRKYGKADVNFKKIGSIRKGYKFIFKPNHPNSNSWGQIQEHRYIMSMYLNRPLEKNEQIHHKNGNRQDNRIENLELWIIQQPAGQRVIDLVEWAKEILKKYENYKIT